MLTKKEIEKIAKLARLRMDEKEKEKFAEDLSSIIGYVQKLSEVNVEKVEPMAGPLRRSFSEARGTNLNSVTRLDDETKCVADSEMRKQIIKAAPDREGDSFKVPSILE